MNYVWKEWIEQSRGKGIWLSLAMVVLISLLLVLQTRTLPSEQGFPVLLLSLYEMNMYIFPLLSLFIASFSIIQEKELKTLMILITKRESYRSFLFKKSIAIQAITLAVFGSWYFLLAVLMKFFFQFNVGQFIAFLSTVFVLIIIFNQIGLSLGSICNTRMQLIGANIFIWFFFVFLLDLFFLYILPSVSYENIRAFSMIFFLDPLQTIPFYLDTSLGVVSMDHLSRLMDKMVWASPTVFLAIDVIVWVILSFEIAVYFGNKGERA
ncbi:copper ABC transporter permease [Bacillus sp. Marseille-P3661]|uniref:copper ABC transporter permease n=1 Tax=Bacillus sp. Marseille-P3661 TaxID=1936234 RepID=UPI000C850C06|nr:copper ABC transporter permease [Bacillus sp. Marseille-P3661]